MSTGVPGNYNRVTRKPYFLSYEGKREDKEILKDEYGDYIEVVKKNKGGSNFLFFGDNYDVLLYLLNNGYRDKVNLIYIDPPFATSKKFINRNQEKAYDDALLGSDYIEFLRRRLVIMRELLSENGSIYLHLDGNMAFAMKIIMDEVFGESNCRAFITRKKCSTKNYTKNTYGNISDYILFYSKTSKYIWNRPYDAWEEEKILEQYPYIDENGRRYKRVPIHAPGMRNGETGKEWRGKLPPKGKHWQFAPDKLEELDKNGDIYWSKNGNPRRKVYFEADKGIPKQDLWLNYRDSANQSLKTTGYPTEKNYEMLKMIISASSNPGDLVLDCFAGSGTTLGAAYELGRNWIGVDNSVESMKAIMKRLVYGMDIYGDYVNTEKNDQMSFEKYIGKCSFSIFALEKDAKTVESL